MSATRPGLAAFNTSDEPQARERLRTWLDAPGWADRVLAGRPYADLGELAAAMGAASATLDDADLEHALARHPRIGERADEALHDAAHSTREQAGVDSEDAELARRLAEGNRAYGSASAGSSSSGRPVARGPRSSTTCGTASTTPTRPSAPRPSTS
jgi:2-oxo-4-hydroxy-4-carboxy-5-ureidoimidazoline decarboxylase